MRVEKVECFVLSHKLERRFHFSQFHYETRSVCLVKISLEDGSFGWGEGYGPAEVIKAGVEFLAPLIVGGNPLNQENLWRAMYLRALDHARRGVLLSALSALDIALWDLKGKILGVPVSVLLGGRKRESVKAYATGMYFTDSSDLAAQLADEAVRHREDGFRAMKMKVGLGLEPDTRNVRAVREAIGSDVELMIDANHAFSVSEAVKLSERTAPFEITWFEEPISPEDYAGYRELRTRSRLPIAGGECEYLRFGFLQLFRGRCVDFAQPDPCAAGGITETKKIADLAQSFGIQFAPHCWGSCVALATSLHLLSNWDPVPGRLAEAEPLLELDRTQNPFREELGTISVHLTKGKIAVPTGPGLGIELDEEMISRYRVG